MAIDPRLSPKPSGDALADIGNWLREGRYVVIFAEKMGLFFHQNCQGAIAAEQGQEFFKRHSVVYIDVSADRDVLKAESWERSLTQEGFTLCKCALKSQMARSAEIPHQYRIELLPRFQPVKFGQLFPR